VNTGRAGFAGSNPVAGPAARLGFAVEREATAGRDPGSRKVVTRIAQSMRV
jgi:hypothetical protein